jgi:hypothetical protein
MPSPHLWETVVEIFADDEIQHGVPQELQAFVVGLQQVAGLVQIGAMGERALQESLVAKGQAAGRLEAMSCLQRRAGARAGRFVEHS